MLDTVRFENEFSAEGLSFVNTKRENMSFLSVINLKPVEKETKRNAAIVNIFLSKLFSWYS